MKKISNSINLIVILYIITLSLFISTFSKVSYACDDVSGTTTISSDCSSDFDITGSNADITIDADISSNTSNGRLIQNKSTNTSLTIKSGSEVTDTQTIAIENQTSGKNFVLLSNAGTISARGYTIASTQNITTLLNSGLITATDYYGYAIMVSSGTITNLTNSGTLSSTQANTIYIEGTITSITNTGTITVAGNNTADDIGIISGMMSTGSLITLNNSQGKDGNDPLIINKVPTNYNVIINSTSDYGQLSVSANSGSTTFGIDSSSTLACETYTSVLSGVATGEISSGKTGTFGEKSWTLSETSSGSETWNLTISGCDSTAPTLSSSTPTDNATNVAVDSNIVLNFSESVDVESGNITIKKTSDNSVIETIDVTSSNVTGTGSSQITINPSNNLDKGVEYYILIAATAFDDSAGNSYAGISSTTALSFTTIFSDPTLDKDITGIINTQTILVNESVNYSIDTINNRLSFLRQNRYSNQLSKNNISLQFNDPALSTLVSAVSAQKTNNEEYANSEWSYWTEGTFSMGSIGENNTSSLIELESTGVAFGLDKNIDSEQLYGVSFQYLQTDSDIGTKGSSVNMENYNLTLYGTRPYRENFVEGLIGVGLIETDIIRKKDSNTYDSSRSGSQLFGSFSMGKEIETKTLNLIPTGTLNLGFTQLNAFSETGSQALKFDKHNIYYKSGAFGLAFENLKKYSQSNFKPFGSIKYNFDFSNASNSKMNYLSDTATIYNYEQKEITDTSFTSLVGFNYLMQNDINISSKYSLVEGNKSKKSQQINFAISTNKKETDYVLAFDGSARQLLKLNVSKNVIGFNLGFGSEVSLKEDAYNLAKINISRNF